MNMKTIGWVLLVVGLIAAAGAWQYGYGATWVIITLIVAAVGAWLAFWQGAGGAPGAM